jgi:uncharacterized protein
LADAPYIRFEWDDAKNDRCVRERGFGLPISCRRSSIRTDGWSVTVGETMAKNVSGSTAARLFVIAYTGRETATRIISVRKANARERDRYGAD